jgi:hypothetical protein
MSKESHYKGACSFCSMNIWSNMKATKEINIPLRDHKVDRFDQGVLRSCKERRKRSLLKRRNMGRCA